MTNGKRRRMMTLILALCLLLIVAIGWQMWRSLRTDRSIVYRERNLPATPDVLCAGDLFTFPVSIDVNQHDSVSRITEGWCNATDGICHRALQLEPYYINFIEPYSVSVVATRTVPLTLEPGVWQLRHCNETHATNLIDVTCWQVQLEVKECTP